MRLPQRLLGARAAERLGVLDVQLGEGSYIVAAEMADSVRRRLGTADRLAFGDLTRLWSNLTVSQARLENAGYLLDYGSAGDILVRSGDVPARQRFTWAHEVGHWLLGRPHRNNRHLERWCDVFAVDLLVPPCRVRASRMSDVDLLQLADEAPDRFDVSTPAAMRQICTVNHCRIVLYRPTASTNRLSCFGASSIPGGLIKELGAATADPPPMQEAVLVGQDRWTLRRRRGRSDLLAINQQIGQRDTSEVEHLY